MNLQNVILIFVGGGLGSVSRYFTGFYISKFWQNPFPFGTFTANVLGCFLIGLIYGFSEKSESLNPQWRFFLATGFCGGYTTFSTFAFENLKLLQNNQVGLFFAYSLLSFVVGLVAVWFGMSLVK